MLLVAVSGGIDSMCLMEKVREEGGPFAVAHCNFGLRGSESDGDEAFVREQAARHGIPCHVKQFDTEAFASAEGISIEMAARRLRYHWFGELCREHGYTAVAVAHNANDNAETLILNLFRGTGLKGITGMKAEGFLPDPDFADIPLLRPLLEMTREEIVAFAREHGLNWREDSTNAQTDYKRNKIRNLVFPVFATINPSFVQTLNRDMERFAAELNLILKNGQNQGREGENQGLILKRAKFSHRSGGICHPLKSLGRNGGGEAAGGDAHPGCGQDKAGRLVEGAWESGDWIKPLGAPGRKKMQDWFTDHHIPADEKPFVPAPKSALADPHHVLAVAHSA